MSDDIFRGVGVEIKLKDDVAFLKIKETLTRMGVAPKRDEKTLYQSAHILHKQGRYAIVHFKEMFLLDGKPSDFSESDKARRDTVARLLEEWGLLTILDKAALGGQTASVKVISFLDKPNWTLVPKYTVGKKRSED
jgi:hypothetical protein